MCAKPVLITKNQKVNIGDQVLASSLFDTFDADGDAISLFRFQDLDGSANSSGSFYNDGTQVTGTGWFEVTAAELANVFFHAAAGLTTDTVRMQIYDGTAWSNIATFGIYTGTPNLLGPNLVVQAGVVVENEIIDLHSMLTYSDPNNDPVVRFKAKDNRDNTGTASGYFVKNGVRQLQKEWFYFTESDNVYYVAAPGHYQEGIQVRAFDGVFWTNPVNSNILTTRNANRPVASYLDSRVKTGELTRISDLVEAYDEDGNTIKSFQFRDTHAFGGSLMFNDQVITPKTWLTVSAAELDQVYFLGAESNFRENLFFRASDGKYWSNLGRVEIESVATPVLGIEHTVMDDLLTKLVKPSVTKDDFGPAYTRYQIVIQSEENSTSSFRLNGLTLSEDTVIDLTVAEFSQLQFRSGVYEQPSLSNLLVRVDNGSFWSDWTRYEYRTEANFQGGISTNFASGTPLSWLDFLPKAPTAPLQITYSFFNILEAGYDTPDVTADNFNRFSVRQRQVAREWLAELESFIDVEFTEVPADSVSQYGNFGGEIRFGAFFNPDVDYAAYAYLPDDPVANPLGGDIWFDNATSGPMGEGQHGYMTIGHELGHAMGLSHPHEGPIVVPSITDNMWHSVMTYQFDRFADLGTGPTSIFANDYGIYDIAALQNAYGANTTYNSGDDVYDFAPTLIPQMRSIWDTGGVDTLDLSQYSAKINIDLRQGGHSNVVGNLTGPFFTDALTGLPVDSVNINIAYGVDIENAIAGDNDDLLLGNSVDNILQAGGGNDWLKGLGGSDTMMGGAGDDTYVWSLADGHDRIDEERMAGRDMLIIENAALVGIDSLTEDISFSRLGNRDLLIDLTIDGGDSIGSILIDYQQGGSRIETLRLSGMAGGVDIDYDLTTFIASLDSSPTAMVATGGTSVFGNILAIA